MDISDFKHKQPEELQRLAINLRVELRDLRFKVATRQWSKVRTVRAKRQELARIETVLRMLPAHSSLIV